MFNLKIELVQEYMIQGTDKFIYARLGVSRTNYINVDSPIIGFSYFDFLEEAQ